MIPNDKIEIRNSYFEYVKKLAKKIIWDSGTHIYLTGNYVDTEVYDLQKVALNMDFIGDISCKRMYFNSVGGCDKPKKIMNFKMLNFIELNNKIFYNFILKANFKITFKCIVLHASQKF